MDSEYTAVEVVVRHVPEPNGGPFAVIQDAIAAGYDTLNPVTGIVQVGVMVDGAFIPILAEKASLVHDAIEAAKLNAAGVAQSTPATSSEAPSTGPQAGTPPELQSEQTVAVPPPGPPQG